LVSSGQVHSSVPSGFCSFSADNEDHVNVWDRIFKAVSCVLWLNAVDSGLLDILRISIMRVDTRQCAFKDI
jgi:hypothetical protein